MTENRQVDSALLTTTKEEGGTAFDRVVPAHEGSGLFTVGGARALIWATWRKLRKIRSSLS